MIIEIIGILATLLILASMCFKTTSYKGSFWMRTINIAGCVVFMVYGIFLPAISTAILNGALVIVNTYHLIMLIKMKNSNKGELKKTDKQSE